MIKSIFNVIFSRQFLTKLMIGAIGWFLRALTVKDSEANTKCLHLVYDLKNLLEEMKRKLFEYNRIISCDSKKIFELKKLLERIELEKNGLTFSCHLLNQLTFQTLDIIRNKNGSEKNYGTLDMLTIWGYNQEKDEFTNITEISSFLSARLPKRFMLWCLVKLKLLKRSLPN